MPEKGWSILTVREGTAEKIKEIAHSSGLTLDEYINELMNPSGKTEWSTCQLCGANVKSKNLHEHMTKVHPRGEHKQN